MMLLSLLWHSPLRKRNLIISVRQPRTFRKEEDILDMYKIIITLKLKLTCVMIQFLFS